MTTINATLLKTLLNDSDIADATMVILIQDAIDRLNTFGAGLSDLSGGSLTATSAQAGAITSMTREVYKVYKNPAESNVNLSGLGVAFSVEDRLMSYAKQLARRLSGMTIRRTP